MPERYDFQEASARAVIDEVSNAGEKQAADLVWPRDVYLGPYTRLLSQGVERGLKIAPYCPGSSGSILRPPVRSCLDLPLGTRLDPHAERQGQPYF